MVGRRRPQDNAPIKPAITAQALDAILEARGPAEPATYAIGCTIKWGS